MKYLLKPILISIPFIFGANQSQGADLNTAGFNVSVNFLGESMQALRMPIPVYDFFETPDEIFRTSFYVNTEGRLFFADSLVEDGEGSFENQYRLSKFSFSSNQLVSFELYDKDQNLCSTVASASNLTLQDNGCGEYIFITALDSTGAAIVMDYQTFD